MPARHAVFLDRDGTLVESDVRDGLPFGLADHLHFTILPGVMDACTMLKDAGFVLVMVTNQPDVARGLVDRRTAEAANQYLVELLHLDAAKACYHDDVDACGCRKPLPGMLVEAATELDITLDVGSYMVGDRWRDIDAGAAAGVTTVFIDHGYAEPIRQPSDHSTTSLIDAVRWILDRTIQETTT
jgi:D-glycero-D-manno-heptose 1,7-bisphosphate phosphatase